MKILQMLAQSVVDWVLDKIAKVVITWKRQREIDAEGKELEEKFEQAESEAEREDAFSDYLNRNRNK